MEQDFVIQFPYLLSYLEPRGLYVWHLGTTIEQSLIKRKVLAMETCMYGDDLGEYAGIVETDDLSSRV